MAKLKISELKATGAELFEDSETFLNELGSDEIENTMGGTRVYPTIYTVPPIKTRPIPYPYPTLTKPLPYTIVIL